MGNNTHWQLCFPGEVGAYFLYPRLVLLCNGNTSIAFCTLHTQGHVVVDSLLSGAVSDADIVFEAVLEDLQVKNSLFRGESLAYF